jgi:hypothetical protein
VSALRVEDFVELERQVWRALADGDADADGRLLSDDFLGVYATGFADRTEHVAQLKDGPTVATFTLQDVRMVVLSETAVLLAYRAEYERPEPADTVERRSTMYVSSLWCFRENRWVNVFSQDTPER